VTDKSIRIMQSRRTAPYINWRQEVHQCSVFGRSLYFLSSPLFFDVVQLTFSKLFTPCRSTLTSSCAFPVFLPLVLITNAYATVLHPSVAVCRLSMTLCTVLWLNGAS